MAAISVEVSATSAGVSLAYRLRGDLAQLRIPASLPTGSSDGLWQHTCFEAFVGIAGARAYREFNFSPSGQWAAYAFADYRQRDGAAGAIVAPQIAVRRFAGRLELDALLDAASLPLDALATTLELGLSTVVEAADGRRSYWALAHPAAAPDFHHRDGFTLRLSAAEASWR